MTDLAAAVAPQIHWISRLVAHDTTSRLSNHPLIDDVETYLHGLGIQSRRIPNKDATKANLFFTVGPPVEGGIVLSGHSDVVPVDGQAWSSDPFKVQVRDGRLYGRGTADMKSFLGIALSLVPEMLAADLKRPIHIAISHDEEDGLVGAPALISALEIAVARPHAVIVGEPTNMAVVEAHKGITGYRTTIFGHEAHSSQPQLGLSAIMVGARLMAHIGALAEELAQAPLAGSDFTPPHSTISVGVVSGGTSPNILARQCEFIWDVRATSRHEQQEIVADVLSRAQELEVEMKSRFDDCGIVNQVLVDAPPLEPDPDNGAVSFLRELTGKNSVCSVSYAAEAGMFQKAGFQTAICGPGSIEQAHKPDEYIELEQVHAGTQMQRRLIRKLALG
jgi:acetylornithine deacetylase